MGYRREVPLLTWAPIKIQAQILNSDFCSCSALLPLCPQTQHWPYFWARKYLRISLLYRPIGLSPVQHMELWTPASYLTLRAIKAYSRMCTSVQMWFHCESEPLKHEELIEIVRKVGTWEQKSPESKHFVCKMSASFWQYTAQRALHSTLISCSLSADAKTSTPKILSVQIFFLWIYLF